MRGRVLAAALVAILLAAAPALAQSKQEPPRFKVVNVADDDVLNVRAAPNAEAEILGRLRPNAGGIIGLGFRDRWIRIRSGPLEGWVNGRYLAPDLPDPNRAPPPPATAQPAPAPGTAPPSAPQASPAPAAPPAASPAPGKAGEFGPNIPSLACFGTEPFWSLELNDDGTAVFRVPDKGEIASKFVLRRAAGTTLLVGFRFGQAAENRAYVLSGENCNDGMSDNTYPYAAIVEAGDRLYGGCCRPK